MAFSKDITRLTGLFSALIEQARGHIFHLAPLTLPLGKVKAVECSAPLLLLTTSGPRQTLHTTEREEFRQEWNFRMHQEKDVTFINAKAHFLTTEW